MLTLPSGGLSWRGATRPALLLLLLTMGTSEFLAKIFERSGEPLTEPLYIATTFATALLLSGTLLWRSGRRFGREDLLVGLFVGLPNLGSLVFLVGALHALPASIVFATFGIGSLTLIVVGGWLLFGERLSRRDQTAIALALASLLLLHVRGVG
jgi:multidrug transporter EmrE-like cation transporter